MAKLSLDARRPKPLISHLRPILDALLCSGVPELFHIARLRSTYYSTSYSTAQIDVLGVLGRPVLNAFERRAARLSAASARCLKRKGILLT